MDTSGRYVPLLKQFHDYRRRGAHSFYFCGGRGIGKTYACLDLMYKIGNGELKLDPSLPEEKFLFLRRTEVETLRACNGTANIFKKYNMNELDNPDIGIEAEYTKKVGLGEFYTVTGKGKEKEKVRTLGYAGSLSTFANSRGLDFSDVTLIVYDECIPESRNKHNLQDEGYLILNLLETVNRNRIIDGQEEVYLIMLSNPIDLGNSMLAQLDITSVMMKMILQKRQSIYIKDRELFIARYSDVKVSEEKAAGMVYKLGKNTGFNERALSGDFVDNDFRFIRRKQDKRQYNALIRVGDITVFRHKSNRTLWIAQSPAQAQYNLSANDADTLRMLFAPNYRLAVASKIVYYDDYQTKVVFDSLIGYRQPTYDKG